MTSLDLESSIVVSVLLLGLSLLILIISQNASKK